MSSTAAILGFVHSYCQANPRSLAFRNWTSECEEHCQSIVNALCNRLAFYSIDRLGCIDGIGIVTTEDYKHFYVAQLLFLTAAARRSIIGQFIKAYPDAIIAGFEKRGRHREWRGNSARLISKAINVKTSLGNRKAA